MKNINISVFLLLFSLSLGAAQLQQPNIEGLQALMQQGTISEDSLKSYDHINAILPGSVAFAKSAALVPGYKDGIYQFVIRPFKQKHVYHFENLEFLKNKQGLLHIVVVGNVGQGSQFILPAMDSVIEGKGIGGGHFLLGYDEKTLSPTAGQVKNSYFFLSGHDDFITPVRFATRHNQVVFATNPQSFIGLDLGQARNLAPLVYKDPLKEFFFAHTRGLSAIPNTKTALTAANIVETDIHNRPARKHQIKQILEYIIAKEKGVKYMTFAAATGSGKTNTVLRLAELIKPKKVLIVTPRKNLITQIVEESRKHYPNLKIASSNESNKTVLAFLNANISNNDITVTSLQGFQQPSVYQNNDLLSKIDVVVFDEAHNLFSSKRNKLVEHLKSFNLKKIELLFFTATPSLLVAHKKSNIKSAYQLSNEDNPSDYHITPFSIFDAIDAKANAPFQIINVVDLPPLKEAFELINGEYNEAHVGKVLADSNDHHGVVFDLYTNSTYHHPEHGNKRTFGEFAMAFCAGIAHAEKLAAFLNSHFKQPTRTDDARVWQALQADYEKNVRKHFSPAIITNKNRHSTEEKITAFLKKYPFVFADAVHSGNEAYPLSEQDADDKLLRNRLGGSLFLAGATKLMEGFDNPRIKVLFNLTPVRKSNIRLVQALGREERIDPENPSAIAKLFEFVYDRKQLLTSSSQVLGVMSYGIALGHVVKIQVDEHAQGTADYKLSYHALADAPANNAKKRALSDEGEDSPPSKKAKTASSPTALKSQLKKLVKELKQKMKVLPRFDNNATFSDEGMDVDIAPTTTASKRKTSSSTNDLPSSAQSESVDHDQTESIIVLLQEAKILFENAKQYFENGDSELSALAKRISDFEKQLGQADTPPVSPKPLLTTTTSTAPMPTMHMNPTRNDDVEEVAILRRKNLGTYARPVNLALFEVERQFKEPCAEYLHTDDDPSNTIQDLDISYMDKVFQRYKYFNSIGRRSIPPKQALWNEFRKQLFKRILSHVVANRIKISLITTGSQVLDTYDLNEYASEVREILTQLGFKEIVPQQPIANNGPTPRDLLFGAANDPINAAWQRQAALFEIDLQKNPNRDASNYKNAAIPYLQLQNWQRAAELLEIAMQKGPFSTQDHLNAARAYSGLDNFGQALMHELAAKRDGMGLFRLGITHLQSGHIESGIRFIKECIDQSFYPRGFDLELLRGKPMQILEQDFAGQYRYSGWLKVHRELIN